MKILRYPLILVGLIFIAIPSCTKDKSPECGLNPPEWLHGNWSDEYGLVEWSITHDNLIKTSLSVGQDFCEEITGPTNDCDCKQWIEEVKTETQYRLRLDTDLGPSFEQADFVFISGNSMSEGSLVFTRH
jgi:hypothetical protein